MRSTARHRPGPRWRSAVSRPVLLTAGGTVLIMVAVILAIVLPGGPGKPELAAGADSTDAATPGATDAGSPEPSGSPTPSVVPTPTGSPAGAPAPPPSTANPPPVEPASGKTWALTFAEEFNGTALDRRRLTPCFDWNSGACTSTFNQGREHYLPSQVVVSNGTAKLIAAPLSPPFADGGCQNGQCTYKSGLLSTARPTASGSQPYLYKFTYGYVEARLKLPAIQGFFTAFWMLPATPSFKYSNEIDILEFLGDDPTTMYMTYHYDDRSRSFHVNNSKGNNGACDQRNYAADFVRVGVDWAPDHIAWYLDGQKCAETRTGIYAADMQIILNLMVDVQWQRDWNVGLTDPTLTGQLDVDYLHVFQQK